VVLREGPDRSNAAAELRGFGKDDAGRIAQLWWESWRSTGLSQQDDPGPDDYRTRLLNGAQADWEVVVATRSGLILGFVAYVTRDRWLRQLFVAPGAKSCGIGTLLLDAATARMPEGFWLRTDARNRAAADFYARRGLVLRNEAPHPERGHLVRTYDWRPSHS
jgi:GNAT superfamily N-acetyltransferase